MTSAIYASLLAFLISWLSMNVIKKRGKHHVSMGDDGNDELQVAIAAQSNAIEYIPIALILLFALEYNGFNLLVVHGLGIAFVIGRVLHARGMLLVKFKLRVLGMKVTLYTLYGLAILNLIYTPYKFLLSA